MKNPRAVVMIIVSIIFAIIAVLMASEWLLEQTKVSTHKVVVAKSDIDLGTRLSSSMLKVVEWPKGSLPEGVFDDPEKLKDRVIKVSLLSGEPLLESKLAPLGTKGGLSAVISEGKRAMTVRVNDVIGVAGFALPGNYVDIVVNTEDDSMRTIDGRNASISKIVLEHILLLAVAQEASRDDTKPKVVNAVTLEVTPEQAEKLDLARSVGQLSLVLRNQFDTSAVGTFGSNKKQMLNRALNNPETQSESNTKSESKPAKPYPPKVAGPRKLAKPKEAVDQVEVVRGIERKIEEFKVQESVNE